jgi:hypothetical protein
MDGLPPAAQSQRVTFLTWYILYRRGETTAAQSVVA